MEYIYIYIYIYTHTHKTQVSNPKGDSDTVLQFNNIQCYSLMSICLGRMVLAHCSSYLNLQQNMSCTGVLECKSTGFSFFFNQRAFDRGHEQFFKVTFPPVRTFFHVGSNRLRKTALPIPHETPCNQHYGFPTIDFNFTHTLTYVRTRTHTLRHTPIRHHLRVRGSGVQWQTMIPFAQQSTLFDY